MYHTYKKEITNKKTGKKTQKWFYWYNDLTGHRVFKTCKKCKTKKEAELYIAALPPVQLTSNVTIKDIANPMYQIGSKHMERRHQFGKNTSPKTIIDARNYINLIIELFGKKKITELKNYEIQAYLLSIDKSGSWKNRFQSIITEIYEEAIWYGIQVQKPEFAHFKRNTVKQTVLSTAEIKQLFVRDNFSSDMFYLFFLTCLSAGLRLGEARALRVCQILFDKQVIIVDGFLNQDGSVRNSFNKKGSLEDPKYRVVLIPEMVAEIIKEYVMLHNINPQDYVFTYNGKPLRQEYAQKEFKRALNNAEIETECRKLSIHALRYTYVTRTRRLIDSSTTMLMSGHTDLKMTDYYTRFELEETINQLTPVKDQIEQFFM